MQKLLHVRTIYGPFKYLHFDSIERLSRVLTAQCLISERNKCRELNGRARNVKFMQILNQLMVHRISQDFHSHNTRWSRKSSFFCVDLNFLYCTIVFSMVLRVPFFSYKHISLYSECSDAR